MSRTELRIFGVVIVGMVMTLVLVLETAPTPREKAALAAAKPAKAR